MAKAKFAKGFTLVELLVALGIIIVFSTYFMRDFGSVLDYKARVDTDNKLKAWRKGVESVYLSNSSTIDNDAAAKLILIDTTQVLPTAIATNRKCNLTAATAFPFANRAGYSAADLNKDGHRSSFCLFITPRLSDTINGTTLFYHSVAVVSGGGNGVIEATTTLNNTTGNLNIDPASDDVGILFDGRRFAADRYEQTIAAMTRAVQAYSTYYSARYQSDSSRSLSTDYFSCGSDTACPSLAARWDQAGEMISTCAAPLPMVQATGVSPHTVLGLSRIDVTDGWGSLFTMDNCTNAVRSPNNATAIRKNPPYTATISATLPGGSVLSMTAVGQI